MPTTSENLDLVSDGVETGRRKEWVRPQLHRLAAASAETRGPFGAEGTDIYNS